MLLTFMLSSKGVAGVPRATLVIIAGTCASFGLPGEAGIAMLLAVDELMDMARTTINVIGNALASVVIARWEGVFGVPDAATGEAPAPAAEAAASVRAEGHS
jgi:Na+/H+-dicarboxylate symporter